MSNYQGHLTALLQELGVSVHSVYRDGPRFWVGRVQRPDGQYLLKAIVNDETWTSPRTGEVYYPSDKLRAEIAALGVLDRRSDAVAGNAPELVAGSDGDFAWVKRRFNEGRGMGVGASPFLYKPEFFEEPVWTALLDYILSVQALTPEFAAVLPPRPHTEHVRMADKIEAIMLRNPTGNLAPLAGDLGVWLGDRVALHDSRRDTITHGEPYPPHIYWRDGRVNLIDWENVMLGNKFQDLAAIWIRGFDRPEWQAQVLAAMQARGLFDSADDRELWDVTVALQSAGNLNYLWYSHDEPEPVKRRAVDSLSGYIRQAVQSADSFSVLSEI